ncbi:NupC/NupG family nucleoside CNT transporter [Sphingomonas solaris]|uniref:NupC/NupG family nucleoside CNT transporter n=1 Tax=Alterirhizorhabdus solaris TaxID=2529389 RepID=A0A558R7J3_9SPHN|nr:NupC/NupG family nucleoside CNT transporter [Sphingomonas solaris]TVV75371.1 NupC/NupG family nucleoside CNT transporter [Sphingomonas solaris]
MGNIVAGLPGIFLILLIAVALSSNRRHIRWRIVAPAFALQVAIAILVLYVPIGRAALTGMSRGVTNLLGYANAGTRFVFGGLASPPVGASFAIQALPVIVFFAALVSILYHLGIMQRVIRWIGGALEWALGISRIEALCAAANIFVGQSESPLVIRPYLARLTPAQLFTVMSSGMAGVAGTLLAAYAQMGISIDYLIAASFMAAPGGILMAKIMMPDDPADPLVPASEEPAEADDIGGERAANVIMAASMGAQLGVRLAVAVGAMVLAFVALVALANGLLDGVGVYVGLPDLSFQMLLGYVFAPVMYALSVPWNEALAAGGLFGEKIVLNEFVAFIHLGQVAPTLSARTVAIVTFALCGFANLCSIAIQMAVTGSLAPNQRPVLARLGLKAVAAGALSNLLSACLAGMVIGG